MTGAKIKIKFHKTKKMKKELTTNQQFINQNNRLVTHHSVLELTTGTENKLDLRTTKTSVFIYKDIYQEQDTGVQTNPPSATN